MRKSQPVSHLPPESVEVKVEERRDAAPFDAGYLCDSTLARCVTLDSHSSTFAGAVLVVLPIFPPWRNILEEHANTESLACRFLAARLWWLLCLGPDRATDPVPTAGTSQRACRGRCFSLVPPLPLCRILPNNFSVDRGLKASSSSRSVTSLDTVDVDFLAAKPGTRVPRRLVDMRAHENTSKVFSLSVDPCGFKTLVHVAAATPACTPSHADTLASSGPTSVIPAPTSVPVTPSRYHSMRCDSPEAHAPVAGERERSARPRVRWCSSSQPSGTSTARVVRVLVTCILSRSEDNLVLVDGMALWESQIERVDMYIDYYSHETV
ncbi:uncharacterized protein BXZ73DRAFT_81490 [Epithele typhae]|uniref:uncharacterized protein n=1 Tax=Epithele typhae TaxID=378194 RepID=UPI002008B494|nr:uncharacterized protein BXZ73DRAFT_81490 [Epithele typhae]KAH9914876.1 hypothetical protein BXZ73DRAFT_81490 [Epithele typhae]